MFHEWLTDERPGKFYTLAVNVISSDNQKVKGV
jgi:hypothetical protein